MESLKFVPFNSTIHPGFWSELSKVKLDVSGLKEEPVDIWGTFTNSDPPGLLPRLSLEWNAFDAAGVKTNWNMFSVKGRVVIKNTIEAFKTEDKAAFIRAEAEKIWSKIVDKSWLQDPSVLTSFSVLMFADLKKYLFYYWFVFPAFNLPAGVVMKSCQKISEVLSGDQILTLSQLIKDSGDHSVCSLMRVSGDQDIVSVPMTQLEQMSGGDQCLVCVSDPSSGQYPGWTVRNMVTALVTILSPEQVSQVRIVCVRSEARDGVMSVSNSLVISIRLEENVTSDTGVMPAVVGWEKNEKGQLGPRLANMRSSMDPVKIAESSVDLNLKLMKWRLVPDLKLSMIQSTKCLLLGAGTLGCAVARGLLGWGIRTITLVDSGKVSFSNPVRQSLFTFQDCLDGGRPKALAAAERLKEIFPGVKAEGHELAIPMPGHNATGKLLEQAKNNYDKLSQLITDHDLIFLLMDSRESRWLPTAMSALHPDKLVINAALGFDTFLVMRHGVRRPGDDVSTQLGCYFCNDVVAPGDSTTDRTLDQQCTVTRPGASGLASSLAVELAVSTLTHDLGPAAPASGGHDSVLGSVPHTIRGSLHGFTQVTPLGPAFSQCTGCSDQVLSTLRSEGWEMVKRVMESPKYLEDLTGLTDLMSDADLMAGVIDIADDDTFSVSSCDS